MTLMKRNDLNCNVIVKKSFSTKQYVGLFINPNTEITLDWE